MTLATSRQASSSVLLLVLKSVASDVNVVCSQVGAAPLSAASRSSCRNGVCFSRAVRAASFRPFCTRSALALTRSSQGRNLHAMSMLPVARNQQISKGTLQRRHGQLWKGIDDPIIIIIIIIVGLCQDHNRELSQRTTVTQG